MKDVAWFRFFLGDYFRRTQNLTRLQRGALNDLTAAYFSNRCLPTDEGMLARICDMNAKEWRANRAAIKYAGQFMDDWRADWIEAELKHADNRYAETAKARAAKAQKRALQPPSPGHNPRTLPESVTGSKSESEPEQKEKGAANQAVTYPKGATSTYDVELNGSVEGATREGNGVDRDHGAWWLAHGGGHE
jgi:uncharacterized protein YdaU (DUF1376 family)